MLVFGGGIDVYLFVKTHLKFNSSPLKSYQDPKGKESPNHLFSGAMLNLGGVKVLSMKRMRPCNSTWILIYRI